jgi:hypothetical protein
MKPASQMGSLRTLAVAGPSTLALARHRSAASLGMVWMHASIAPSPQGWG